MKGVIVADDLTGANASGVLLKKIGLSVSSLFRLTGAADYPPRRLSDVSEKPFCS